MWIPSFRDDASFESLHSWLDDRHPQAGSAAYESVDDIGLWVGALSAPHLRGATVGPLLDRILVGQFTALRDGDRFWQESSLAQSIFELVQDQTLTRIVRRNTDSGGEFSDHFFLAGGSQSQPKGPKEPMCRSL